MSPTCAYAHRDTKERTAKVSEYRVCKQLLMLCFSSVFRDCLKSQLTLCTAVPWVGLSLRFYVAWYMQVLAVELNRIELLLLFFLFSHERSRGVMLLVALGKSPPPRILCDSPYLGVCSRRSSVLNHWQLLVCNHVTRRLYWWSYNKFW